MQALSYDTSDFSSDDAIEDKEKSSKILLGKKVKSQPKEKRLHIILKGDSIRRLEKLKQRVDPSTNTETMITSLQFFEAFLDEHDSGSEFYIKRKGDDKPTKWEIFGEA